MHESQKGQTCALPVLLDRLEYIPVRSDPVRRVPVSDMPEEDAKEPKSIFATMDKLDSVLGLIACFGMYYLLIRMGYGVIW